MTLPVGGGDEFAYDASVELFSDVYVQILARTRRRVRPETEIT